MDWLSITALVLTPLSAIIGWIVRDRKVQKQEVIKGDIDIQKEQIDLAKNTRDLLLLKEQDHKLEKEEFRKELFQRLKYIYRISYHPVFSCNHNKYISKIIQEG